MTIEALRPRYLASALCVIACCLLSACIFSSREVADAPDSDATSDVSDTATNDADDAVNDADDTDVADVADTTDGTSDVSDISETGDAEDAAETDVDEDTDLQCSDPLVLCEGECVDTSTSVAHCGECDQSCDELENAVAECDASECNYTCEDGYTDINDDLGDEDSDGCEGECSADEVRTYYLDGDNDDYGTPNTSVESCPSDKPSGYVANSGDCDDQDDRVNPDYTGGFQTQSSAGGIFDYNCKNGVEKEYTSNGQCSGLIDTCNLTEGWQGGVLDCGMDGQYIESCGTFPTCGPQTRTETQGCK